MFSRYAYETENYLYESHSKVSVGNDSKISSQTSIEMPEYADLFMQGYPDSRNIDPYHSDEEEEPERSQAEQSYVHSSVSLVDFRDSVRTKNFHHSGAFSTSTYKYTDAEREASISPFQEHSHVGNDVNLGDTPKTTALGLMFLNIADESGQDDIQSAAVNYHHMLLNMKTPNAKDIRSGLGHWGAPETPSFFGGNSSNN